MPSETHRPMVEHVYQQIDDNGVVPAKWLTKGWHFCNEWGRMLVGPTMPEWQACMCEAKIKLGKQNAPD